MLGPFDPSIPVSPFLELPARGGLNAADLTAGFAALIGPDVKNLSEEKLLRRIRVFYPDATREEAAFLMPGDGTPFTLEYVQTLLCLPLGPSFDPVAEALRAYAQVPPPLVAAAQIGEIGVAGAVISTGSSAAALTVSRTGFKPLSAAAASGSPAHATSSAMNIINLRRFATALQVKNAAILSDPDISITTLWDTDNDGRLCLEDVRAALVRYRIARAAALPTALPRDN